MATPHLSAASLFPINYSAKQMPAGAELQVGVTGLGAAAPHPAGLRLTSFPTPHPSTPPHSAPVSSSSFCITKLEA